MHTIMSEARDLLLTLLEEGQDTEAVILAWDCQLDGIDPDGELAELLPWSVRYDLGLLDTRE